MRNLILLVALSVVSAVSLYSFIKPASVTLTGMDHPLTLNLFKAWKVEHTKDYQSDAEHQYRLTVFAETLRRIDEQRKYVTHQVGLNKFSDMTIEEFKVKHTGLKRSKNLLSMLSETQMDGTISLNNPASVDHRECLTPIKDQGDCGSCWTFSAICAAEFAYNCPVGGNRASRFRIFSEQNLIDCDTNGNGCDGGDEIQGLQFIRKKGIVPDSVYPYEQDQFYCEIKKSTLFLKPKKSGQRPTLAFVTVITPRSPQAMETAVAERVTTSALSSEILLDYNGGILADPKSCSATEDDIDHAVNLVGYGNQGGQNYWLLRNSWSPSWGENGYFRILKDMTPGSLGCLAVNVMSSYPVVNV